MMNVQRHHGGWRWLQNGLYMSMILPVIDRDNNEGFESRKPSAIVRVAVLA